MLPTFCNLCNAKTSKIWSLKLIDMHHYVTLWKLPIPIWLSAICSTFWIKTVLTKKKYFVLWDVKCYLVAHHSMNLWIALVTPGADWCCCWSARGCVKFILNICQIGHQIIWLKHREIIEISLWSGLYASPKLGFQLLATV